MINKVSIIIVVLGLCTVVMANNLEEMPIAAKAGQCFTKAFYPPQYTKVTKVKSTKRVLLNEASVKYEVIPAKYSVYEEKIKVSDGKEKIITIPAVYRTVQERVLVEVAKKFGERVYLWVQIKLLTLVFKQLLLLV